MQLQPLTSIIIPALNEENRIGATIQAVKQGFAQSIHSEYEIIVVDDGSVDQTSQIAKKECHLLLRHAVNRGKGASLETGLQAASGDYIMFLDADLEASAQHAPLLLKPLQEGIADMTIAKLPKASRKGGFGFVKRLATEGIYRLSGYRASAPLSGQRVIRKDVLEAIGGLSIGFGIEVGLTIDVARGGFNIVEVEVPFYHRETGRNWSGFVHRGKQFIEISKTLLQKWRNPAC